MFAVFARFEYALKRADFVEGNRNRCEPAWDKFTSAIKEKFNDTHIYGLIEAKAYFDSAPPLKQIVQNGELDWKETVRSGQCDSLWYGVLVRHVRNNLFHGEKMSVFRDKAIIAGEPNRNLALIFYSLVMLEAFLSCDDRVRRLFIAS